MSSAAAPPSGQGVGPPAAAAHSMAERRPHAPSIEGAEVSEFSELDPQALTFDTLPIRSEVSATNQAGGSRTDGEAGGGDGVQEPKAATLASARAWSYAEVSSMRGVSLHVRSPEGGGGKKLGASKDMAGCSKVEEKRSQVNKSKSRTSMPSKAEEGLEAVGSHAPAEHEVTSRPNATKGGVNKIPGRAENTHRAPATSQRPHTRAFAREQGKLEQAEQHGREQVAVYEDKAKVRAGASVSARPPRAAPPRPKAPVTAIVETKEPVPPEKPSKMPAISQTHSMQTRARKGPATSSSIRPVQGAGLILQEDTAAAPGNGGGPSREAEQQKKIRFSISGFSGLMSGGQKQQEKDAEWEAAAAEASTQLGFKVDTLQLANLNAAFGLVRKGPKQGVCKKYTLQLHSNPAHNASLISFSKRNNILEADEQHNAVLVKLFDGFKKYPRKNVKNYRDVMLFFSTIGLDLLE
ncbi:g2598 [Coccomyxa elongata]